MNSKNILLTGGAGFIGSAVIRYVINRTNHRIINIDKLTYAGNKSSLKSIEESPRYNFFEVDICDRSLIDKIFCDFKPSLVMHLAAESHVDRSINNPSSFIKTNIIGTYELLEASKHFYNTLNDQDKANFVFHHVSTDEVYGDLKNSNDFFTEDTPYDPSSPYSASKASSDHLVRAWYRTFGLPIIITNCSNNYGPFQFPEKLIPHIILNAMQGKVLPVYGKGNQIRDWLYVDDHARALLLVALNANVGKTYNIGGYNQKKNIDVVQMLCDLLEELSPSKPKGVNKYKDLIRFIEDRPGHDIRYAINAKKISDDLGWRPEESFETGLRKTVQWYLENNQWWKSILKKRL